MTNKIDRLYLVTGLDTEHMQYFSNMVIFKRPWFKASIQTIIEWSRDGQCGCHSKPTQVSIHLFHSAPYESRRQHMPES